MDHLLFIFTDAPAGIFEGSNMIQDAGREFYWVEYNSQYYLVMVVGENVESQSIEESIVEMNLNVADGFLRIKD